jgi:hypothetical protein
VPDSHLIRRTRVDWPGLALLIVGIGSLQVLLERGESKDWFDSREIIVEAAAAAIGLAAFVWHELRTRDPIVDLRILRNRQLAGGVAFAVVLGFALYSSVFALPVFTQNLLGYSAWAPAADSRRHRERLHDGVDGSAERPGDMRALLVTTGALSSGRCGSTTT